MNRYVFISYTTEDYSEACWVKDRLEQAGIPCWMAPSSIPGGSDYTSEIPRAIRECSAFVVIVSAKSQESKWVPREIDQAINAGKLILPFCIDQAPLKDNFVFFFSTIQRYTAWEDREKAMRAMTFEIKKVYMASPFDNPSYEPPRPVNTSRKGNKPFIAVLLAAICILAAVAVILWKIRSDHVQPAADIAQEPASEASVDEDNNAENADTDTNDQDQGETAEVPPETMDQNSDVIMDEPADNQEQDPEIVYNTRGVVRIINKKEDKSKEFERLASRFQEESGIKVFVETPGESKYSETLKNEITGSSSDPTLFMLGGTSDFEKYGSECLELSDTAAAKELVDESYTLKGSNGKIYGLACIVEAYGLAVNTRLLGKAGYQVSDIQSFADLRNIAEDITRRKQELGFSAFTSPSVGVGISGDYRFAEHSASVPLWYELQDNDFNIGMSLQGTYVNRFRDFIDLYLDNATVPRSAASSRTLNDAQEEFLLGKAVFHQDGSWNTDDLRSIFDDGGAVIPLYMGMPGEENQGINETSSYFWCVNKYASPDDKLAALQFLQWLVTSEAGIRIMTKDMGFQLPYRRAWSPDDLFLKTLQENKENGLIPIRQFYKSGSYTTWTNALKNAIEDYANGTRDWTAIKEAFVRLW